jgi:hypothetical protein
MSALLQDRPTRTRRSTGTAWVLWRQHRAALFGAVGLFGAAAVLLLAVGIPMHSAYHDLNLDTCRPGTDLDCGAALDRFITRWGGWGVYLPRLLEFLPALAGAFVGAPLLAREYESGTFRFAWTQGTGRVRWVLSRLIVLGGVLTVAALGFSLLFMWWYSPFEAVYGRMSRGEAFEVEGVVFAARTLFTFCAGAFAGALIRRTVPALAATLVGWLSVVLAFIFYFRPRFAQPVVVHASIERRGPLGETDWILGRWLSDPSGHRLSDADFDALINSLARKAGGELPTPNWLADHGYIDWKSFHPASRFWQFQLTEATSLTALALLLGAATIYLVKRP